jgi:hypothetical protein
VQAMCVEYEEFLDRWFSRAEAEAGLLRYVGMPRDEAVHAAESEEVRQVRIIEISSGLPLTADYRPSRLNLAIQDDRVVRAAFF